MDGAGRHGGRFLFVTCGEGMKHRTRTCNGPAKVCVGEQQQVHECNLPACTTTSTSTSTTTSTTPKITTTVVSTTTLPALGIIPDGHPDYDILMHKPGHCSGTWTEWSDHTGLDDTSIQCSSPFRVFPAILSSPLSVDVRDKTYKHDWRVTGNVLVHVFDGEWFFGISDRDFRQGYTKKRTPSILNRGPCDKISKFKTNRCESQLATWFLKM